MTQPLTLTKITKLNDTIFDLKKQLDDATKSVSESHLQSVENLKREHNDLVSQVDATHLAIKSIVDQHSTQLKDLNDKIDVIISQLS